ncbi:acyl-CoA carboxylase subunit epsilon [Kitasatospora sp. NBC_00070]|uniref:acyl-CoA carboxylase subunit epsilon n=1 Tax=Kitasatospora sp. NBC_00070 TaxID=2975962 RepID=UPI003251C11B
MTITVTRGSLTDEEIAALTVALLSRCSAAGTAAPAEAVVERQRAWHRTDYAPPSSWQTAA